MPYVYAPRADGEQVGGLIRKMSKGEVDVILFTSSPQVDRLYEVAGEENLVDQLEQGMHRTQVAAIGPIVAQNLRDRGGRADICPEQGFVMKNLVQQIKRVLSAPQAQSRP